MQLSLFYMKLINLLVLIFLFSCQREGTKEPASFENVTPFEITVVDMDYASGGRKEIQVTNKDLKIIGHYRSKDSVLFYKHLPLTKNLTKISQTNFDSLKEEYVNHSIKDGTQLHVRINKKGKEKSIRLNNYYRKDVKNLIDLINAQLPDKFQINYKKENMLHPSLR